MTIKKNTQHAAPTEKQIRRRLAAQLRRGTLTRLDPQGLDTDYIAVHGLAAYAQTISRQRRRTN